MLLATRRAALEVGPEPREPGLGIEPLELQLDVSVDYLEARLAADLRRGRTEKSGDDSRRVMAPGHEQSTRASPAR